MNVPNRRAVVIGLPSAVMETDRELRRLRARQRGLLDRARPKAKAPRELQAEIEEFERGPQRHGYKYVELSDVAEETKEAVRDGVRRAVNKLAGYPPNADVYPPRPTPATRYIRLCRAGEQPDFTDHRLVNGLHRWGSATICIRADLPPRQARATAVHEVAHSIGGLGHPQAENFSRQLVTA